MSRLVLHVGTPKTGTTFLQRVLWGGREQVAEDGVRLPGRRLHHHYLACVEVIGHADHLPRPGDAEGAWTRLLDEVEGPQTWLVSHELFSLASQQEAVRAVEQARERGHDVSVVVTARDEARQVPAQWQEHLKHRASVAFEDYLDALADAPPGTQDAGLALHWPAPDALEVVRRWASAVGADRVQVVTVPPSAADPAVLWERFCSVLGLDPAGYDLLAARGNESVRAEQAEVLRRVNAALGDRLPLPGDYTSVVKGELAHGFLAGRPGSSLTLPADAHRRAVVRSEQVVAGLADLGVRVVGDLDDLRVAPDADRPDRVGALDRDLVLEETVAALAHALTRLAEERTGRMRAERRLRRAERADGAREAPRERGARLWWRRPD